MTEPVAYRYWHTRGWEERAATVVAAMTGASVRFHDDGSEEACRTLRRTGRRRPSQR
jgi:hypothetical protein